MSYFQGHQFSLLSLSFWVFRLAFTIIHPSTGSPVDFCPIGHGPQGPCSVIVRTLSFLEGQIYQAKAKTWYLEYHNVYVLTTRLNLLSKVHCFTKEKGIEECYMILFKQAIKVSFRIVLLCLRLSVCLRLMLCLDRIFKKRFLGCAALQIMWF